MNVYVNCSPAHFTGAGNVASCQIGNVNVDMTDILLDYLSGGDVDTPAALSCIVTVSGAVTITWESEDVVHYNFAYQLDVQSDQCADTIEAWFNADPCGQTYALTATQQGPVDEGGLCESYNQD